MSAGDDVGPIEGEFVGFPVTGKSLGEFVGSEVTGEVEGSEVTGDLLGKGMGFGVGSNVARFINVQAFPVPPSKHSVSAIPSLFPSTTMYSVVSTEPLQSRHLIAEYEPPLLSEDSILPAQALVSVLVT